MKTNTPSREWMLWLTDPIKREDQKIKNRGIGDDFYSLVICPMSFLFSGERWLFASNGAASLLVRGESLWNNPSAAQESLISGLIRREVKGRPVLLSAFKRWLGKGWRAPLPCNTCSGDWSKNCQNCFGLGTRQTKCDGCGGGHDCRCQTCSGEGVVYCPNCVGDSGGTKRPGHYRNVVFDRAVLARFLAHVDSDENTQVKIMALGANQPIWIEPISKQWRVIIMPLREPCASEVPGFR